jgi:NIMA (never in mitosis gene a)-related kinase
MDFCDDGDLYQKIVMHQKHKTNFTEDQVLSIFLQMTIGIKNLHDLKILHRDLKSANIFMHSSGLVQLGDLNVSKIAKKGLLYTQTGTPYYASPEVWKDQPYDNKSDIWSLGCVLYEVVALKPPFQASDMDGLYKKVLKGAYPKIPDCYSAEVNQLLSSLLKVIPG